jgi:long-chain acyl-CoA synthetase
MTTEISTLIELHDHTITKHRHDRLLNSKRDESWVSISTDEFAKRVRTAALGLHELGIKRGNTIAYVGQSSPEWTIIDMAILNCGALGVPIYTTQSVNQVEYILKNSEAKAIFVGSEELYTRLKSAIESAGVSIVIGFNEPVGDSRHTLASLQEAGAESDAAHPELYQKIRSETKPDDLATIIYTSGTTGDPKGVMLTHANLTSNVTACLHIFDFYAHDDVMLTYLPPSHIFERMILYVYQYSGVQIWYAESIEKLADNLKEVKPMVMTTVPRMLEKVFERVNAMVETLPGPRKAIFKWAIRVANKYDTEGNNSFLYNIRYNIANKLVYKKLRMGFGGRIRMLVAGGAALNPELGRIFTAAGMPVLQGYGLTETSPVISVNRLNRNRMGSIGEIIPGVEVRIAEDGEILVKGPNVMKGYYRNEEATDEVFYDGWFKTGDIGYIDKDGFLYITDRKKDFIKTSGGKYIAPQLIEQRLARSKYIEQAVVIGDKRKFASALLFPGWEALRAFAEGRSITYTTDEELLKHPDVHKLFDAAVEEVNKTLAQWETIKKYEIIPGILTIDNDQLTPTLKVRRRNIEQRYTQLIDEFYKEEHVEPIRE